MKMTATFVSLFLIVLATYARASSYPKPYSYYVQKYNFDSAVRSSGKQDIAPATKSGFEYFVNSVAPKLPVEVDAQMVLWWAYIEGILRLQDAPWGFSNCDDRNFQPDYDCAGLWQVGYGIQVNDHLRDLSTAFSALYSDIKAKEIGDAVLKKAGLSLRFPDVDVAGLSRDPNKVTQGKTNRYWASVLMRDPLISSFLEARTLVGWNCYFDHHPKWCNQYYAKRKEYSAAMVAVIKNWEAVAPQATQSATDQWRVYPNGVGPIRVGMSPLEASQAIGAQLVYRQGTSECYYVHLEKEPKGVDFMIIGDRIARIDVNTPEITTVSGARVGHSETQIKSRYPGQLTVGPHKYVEKGHYLTFIPKDPQYLQYRIVFETDGKVVTSYRAGKLPEVEWVEHCL